jgi:hypothetical protein
VLYSKLSELKWLRIRASSFHSNLLQNGEEDSAFFTDAIFVNLFSLMQLEDLDWMGVCNSKVTTRVVSSLLLELNNIVILFKYYFLIPEELTWRAYRALLEGPFANSILESYSLGFKYYEYSQLKAPTLEGTADTVEDYRHCFELLGKLLDRMEENRKTFPWKTLFSDMEGSDGCVDFV